MNLIIFVFLLALGASAQTTINGSRSILGAWDASAATSTKPLKSGTATPGTCSVPEMYFETDATAGTNIWLCTATNTWTQVTGAGLPSTGGTGIVVQTGASTTAARSILVDANEIALTNPDGVSGNLLLAFASNIDISSKTFRPPGSNTLPVSCTLGQIYFDRDATAGQNLYGCTATNTWTLLGGGSADPNTVTAAGTLTSNAPMIGAGSKAAAVGSRSGNTTEFATVTGTKTASKQLAFDASGNIVASAYDAGSGGATAVTGLTNLKTTVASATATIAAGAVRCLNTSQFYQVHAISSGTVTKSSGTETGKIRIASNCNSGSPILVARIETTITLGNYSCSGVTCTAGNTYLAGDQPLSEIDVSSGTLGTPLDLRDLLTSTEYLDGSGLNLNGRTFSVNSALVGFLGVANNWTAAQTFTPSASTAGAKLACAALPSSPANGDFACDSGDSNKVKGYSNGAWVTIGGGGSGTFDGIGTGTNTTATMTVGTGGTLTTSGSGVVNANQFKGNSTIADADVAASLARDSEVAAAYLPLAGGTLTGQLVSDNLGIEFEESDTNPTCSAGNFHIFADLSENRLKKCQNGTATDLDTGGSPGGSTTQVQYNSSGSFAGDAGFVYDATNKAITLARSGAGSYGGSLVVSNNGSGADTAANSYADISANLVNSNNATILRSVYANLGGGSSRQWGQLLMRGGTSDVTNIISMSTGLGIVSLGGAGASGLGSTTGWMELTSYAATRFANEATAGRGLVSISAAPSESTGQTGNAAATTLLASGHTAGMYRVCGFVAVTAAGTGNTTAWTLSWRSPASATDLTHNLFFSSGGAETDTFSVAAQDEFNVCKVIRSTNASNISLNPGDMNTATYTMAWTIERLR